MLKRYLDYIKDNPERYWFKAKWFGWGWTPATWEGWLTTAVYVAVLAFLASSVDESAPTREVLFMFWLPFVLLTISFIRIAYLKGEKPRWQWGLPRRKDKKKSDA